MVQNRNDVDVDIIIYELISIVNNFYRFEFYLIYALFGMFLSQYFWCRGLELFVTTYVSSNSNQYSHSHNPNVNKPEFAKD